MGKLRDSIKGANRLMDELIVAIGDAAEKLKLQGKEAQTWMSGGSKGVEELYMYLVEKLKAKNVQYQDVENDPISAHADQNVVRYLQGIQQIRAQVEQELFMFGPLRGNLSRFGDAVTGIKAQIAKKKNRLLKSKKFKDKIALYERFLGGLEEQARALDHKLDSLNPITGGQIKQQLEVKPSTTLKQLAGKTTEVKFLYTELEKKQQNAESLLSDREAKEFEKQIEMIKKMVADADEMEAEGNE